MLLLWNLVILKLQHCCMFTWFYANEIKVTSLFVTFQNGNCVLFLLANIKICCLLIRLENLRDCYNLYLIVEGIVSYFHVALLCGIELSNWWYFLILKLICWLPLPGRRKEECLIVSCLFKDCTILQKRVWQTWHQPPAQRHRILYHCIFSNSARLPIGILIFFLFVPNFAFLFSFVP